MILPRGEIKKRDIIERPDSVGIIPLTSDNKILMIEEYPAGARTFQLAFPGGKTAATSEKELLQEAQRELREETGYRAGKIQKLISFNSCPAYMRRKVHIFLAAELEYDPLPKERDETIRVVSMTLDKATREIMKEFRSDPETVAAFSVFLHKLGHLKVSIKEVT